MRDRGAFPVNYKYETYRHPSITQPALLPNKALSFNLLQYIANIDLIKTKSRCTPATCIPQQASGTN
jgi:hypothetical protein